MANSDGLTEILALVYDAAIEPRTWSRVMGLVRDSTQALTSSFNQHDFGRDEHRILEVYPDDPAARLEYSQRYGAISPFAKPLLRKRAGWVGSGSELIGEDELVRTEYYSDFLRKLDLHYSMAVQVMNGNQSLATISFFRNERAGQFDQQDHALLATLAPHFERALIMSSRLNALEARISDLESALDRTPSAMILLDGTGRCLLANRAAKAILDQRCGLSLERSGERSMLAARGAGESSRLREAISLAIAAGEGKSTRSAGAVLISRPGRRPLHVVVAPFRSEIGMAPRNAAVIVFLDDPEQKAALPSEVLRMLFGLTPAEIRLALSILDGQSLAEAAETYRVTQETIRSQVKSIFQKTGTRRQAELMRLLAGLAGSR